MPASCCEKWLSPLIGRDFNGIASAEWCLRYIVSEWDGTTETVTGEGGECLVYRIAVYPQPIPTSTELCPPFIFFALYYDIYSVTQSSTTRPRCPAIPNLSSYQRWTRPAQNLQLSAYDF